MVGDVAAFTILCPVSIDQLVKGDTEGSVSATNSIEIHNGAEFARILFRLLMYDQLTSLVICFIELIDNPSYLFCDSCKGLVLIDPIRHRFRISRQSL